MKKKKEHKVVSTVAGEERVVNQLLEDGWLVKKMKFEKLRSGKIVYLLEKKYNNET